MIPKVIHYCWFGGNALPSLVKKCIKSWKKYCPDYQIIEWNESNFDVASNLYMKEAYDSKMWAFVTDYVRLWVLYNYGGIYMDTDVEVVKSLNPYLDCQAFTGFESNNLMATGIMGCVKGNVHYENLLKHYDEAHFINTDGTLNKTANTETITEYFLSIGFLPNNKLQIIDGFMLYPSDFFCPKDWKTKELNLTANTVCIHHFSGSWKTKEEKKAIKKYNKTRKRELRKQKLKKIIGEKAYNFIKKMVKRK